MGEFKVFLYQISSPYGCYQETGQFYYDEDMLLHWKSRTSLTRENFIKPELLEKITTNNWTIETCQENMLLNPYVYSYALPFAYFGSLTYFKPIEVYIVFDDEIDATIFKLLAL
jgi:hypothetical protein